MKSIMSNFDLSELDTIEAQQQSVNQRLAETRARIIQEIQSVIDRIGASANDFVFKADELRKAQDKKPRRSPRKQGPAKFVHPEGSKQWDGMGRKPKWVRDLLSEGFTLDDLAIKNE